MFVQFGDFMMKLNSIFNYLGGPINWASRFRFVLASIVFISIILTFSFPIQSEAASAASAIPIVVRPTTDTYYLQAVNSIRIAHHLKPLMIDDRLDHSAANKNIDMINNDYWDHIAPSQIRFSDFIWNQSPRASHVGENLARCFKTNADAMKAFEASPTHYANIVGDYTAMGVSVSVDPTTQCNYVTMHFASYK